MDRVGRTLLGIGQWKVQKEGASFGGTRRMNVAAQAGGQFADNLKTSTAPDGLRR
jgi:hypothetical protein